MQAHSSYPLHTYAIGLQARLDQYMTLLFKSEEDALSSLVDVVLQQAASLSQVYMSWVSALTCPCLQTTCTTVLGGPA